MWKYYKDVTLYALAICCFIAVASSATYTSVASGVLNTLVIFGTFGTGLGVLTYNYFQKQQYYFYHNLGFTKRELIIKTWLVNLVIVGVLILCTSFFL